MIRFLQVFAPWSLLFVGIPCAIILISQASARNSTDIIIEYPTEQITEASVRVFESYKLDLTPKLEALAYLRACNYPAIANSLKGSIESLPHFVERKKMIVLGKRHDGYSWRESDAAIAIKLANSLSSAYLLGYEEALAAGIPDHGDKGFSIPSAALCRQYTEVADQIMSVNQQQQQPSEH